MKQDNEIDQLFRDASSRNGAEEIPRVFLTDLNARLDALEKKRKKPIAFWWLIGVFSISLFTWGATLFFHSSDDKPIIAKTNNVIKVKSVKSKAASKSAPISIRGKIANAVNYISENKITSAVDYSAEIKSKANVEKNKAVASRFKKIETAQNILKPQSTPLSGLNVNEQSSEKLLSESIKEIFTLNTLSEIENLETPEEKKVVQVTDSSKALDSLLTKATNEKTELIEGKKKPSIQKEIGFFTGVSGIISSFDIPSANLAIVTTIPEWRETREREEVSTTSWDFSLRMKWVINGFSIQTGLDYFQWGEQIKYNYNSISGINRYSYLNIPINLGYAKTWNKFGLNPFAGVLFGYGFNRTGNYLQPDLISIASAESKKYLANYQIGCELYFLSDSQFKFSLIPVYRASFKEVVFTDLIRNRYKSIGLQLGISYNF
jgi:hypothetical protein